MKRLWTRITLTIALVLLLADLPLRSVPLAASGPDLPYGTPVIAPAAAQGRLNSPDIVSSVMATETKKLFANAGVFQDMLGTAVAMEGDTIAAGAPQAICSAGDPCLPGSASIFTQSMTGEWPEQRITPYDGHINDFFGEAIAISGDILVVGANESDGSNKQGSMYIYQRSQATPGDWEIVTKWEPTNPNDYLFGWSVAASGDTVVVGAPTSYFAGYPSAAYLFERNQGGANHWGLVRRWTPVATPPVIGFGMSASIDEDTLVVGARQEAYVYERDLGGPGAWGQRQRITPPDGATRCFGYSSSIQGDTLVIGDECDLGFQGPYGSLAKGAAYIYIRNPISRLWGLVRKLVPSDSDSDKWVGYFGSGVSVDGDTIVVGAPYVKVGANDRQGAAYLFCRNKDGINAWGEVTQLTASDGAAYDYFGHSVATQGGSVVVGSPYANINGNNLQGAAYLYAGCKQPLVFIHGIAGSKMVDRADGNKEVWPDGIITDLKKLSLFTSDKPSDSITPVEPIMELPLRGGTVYRKILEALKDQGDYREYQVNGDITRQTVAGCKEQYELQKDNNPDLFVFTYDWRESMDDTAAKLKDYMACVQQFFPNTKVNILAHSMGGLVARRYILKNPMDHNINALITVGSPFLGAPKLPYVLETGNFYDWAANILRADITRYISGSFTGAHQLVPSLAWYELGGDPPVVEKGYDLNLNDNPNDPPYNYDQLIQMLDSRYGDDDLPGSNRKITHEFLPGSASKTFHTTEQDNWSGDLTGILYHHIYGEQYEIRTIGQVLYTVDLSCLDDHQEFICKYYPPVAVPKFTIGDKTVPVLSAVRIGKGKNYNAPDARLYMITNPDDELASHVGMLSNSEVIQLILKILKDPTYAPSSTPENHTAQLAPVSFQPTHYLTIAGGNTVTVRDAFGHDSGPVSGSDLWQNSVPGVDLYTLDDRITTAILPVGEMFTVTFTTLGDPFRVDLRTGTGSSITQFTRYRDVNQPVGVPVQLIVTSQGSATLKVDQEGDGVFETEIEPSIEVSGATELDMDPPEVIISSTENRGTTAVTISATDPGSGVKTVLYSLDGVHFSPYTAPFEVQGCHTPVIYAFAEDQLLNRSGLVTKDQGCAWLYLPDIRR